jgi:hypothetical protein
MPQYRFRRYITVRVLYVPNERGAARQHGMRRAFGNLVDAGLLEAWMPFSALWRVGDGETREAVQHQLLDVTQEFQPDLILLQHLGGTGFDERTFAQLRRTAPNAQLVYHEADPYTRFLHPLPREARAAAAACDVSFAVGSGTFLHNLRRAGAPAVRWVPSVYVPDNLREPDPQAATEFDVVMIANRNQARLRGLPNRRERARYVALLTRRYGSRFAIFGRGWSGPSAQGSVPYSQQQSILDAAVVSTNWDHFRSEPQYFSDRLPTALASASLHVTSNHEGYEHVFPAGTGRFLGLASTFKDAVKLIDAQLDTPPEEREKRRREGRAFAAANFRQDDNLVSLLNWRDTVIDPERARDSWDTNVTIDLSV